MRLGRTAEACDAYHRALALVHNDAERRLLNGGWRSCTATGPTRAT
jgi:predicted RNA polymerase sigma factor